MKTQYQFLLFTGALVGTNAVGQQLLQLPPSTPSIAVEETTVEHRPAIAKASGDTVFSDDFANGLAGNNQLSAPWTQEGPHGTVWEYDTNGPSGSNFSNAGEIISSTTVGNGFMIFDSELFNDNCVVPGPGPCVGLDGYLVSPVMDLSGTPNVLLQFEERLRWCCTPASPHFVDVSTDGGATWTWRAEVTKYPIFNISEVETNEDIGTHVRLIDISPAIAGNAANVKFRFAHENSAVTTATADASHYHWQVDDVMLIEAYDNDLSILEAIHEDHLYGFIPLDNYNYSVYPFSQLRPLDMMARIENRGKNDATNVELSIDVSDGSSSVYNTTETIASLAAGTRDSIIISAPFTPPAVNAMYEVTFGASSDSTDNMPADNMALQSFQVDEHTYAADLGVRNGFYNNGVFSGTTDTRDYQIGNVFFIANEMMLTGIQVAVTQGVGADIRGGLYITEYNTSPIQLAETETKTLTGSDLTPIGGANWVTLPFAQPIPLDTGTSYLAVLQHFGGTNQVSVAMAGRASPGLSWLLDNHAANPGWGIDRRIPMVRLTSDPTVGLQEEAELNNGLAVGYNYPDPANDVTTIVYTLSEASNVTLRLMDLSGKTVREVSFGKRTTGDHRYDLSTIELAEGTYFYTVSTDNARVTRKLMVTR